MTETLLGLKPAQLMLVSAIAETGQLQLAAAQAGMAQPAASRRLAEVEALVGAPLFRRTPKGMEPTLIGRVLARRAGAMVQQMRDMAREVQELRDGLGGVVRVGAVTGAALGYLVPAIRQVKARSPEVEITVEVAPSSQLLRALAAGQLDFALARLLPDYETSEIEIQPGRDERVVMLARRGHPLSGPDAVTLRDLREYEWVIQESGAPIRQALQEAFAESRLDMPRSIVNSSSLILMIGLLTQGNTVAPVAEEVARLITGEAAQGGLVLLPLEREIRVRPYFLLSSRGRMLSPVAGRLRALVANEMNGGT